MKRKPSYARMNLDTRIKHIVSYVDYATEANTEYEKMIRDIKRILLAGAEWRKSK